MGTPKQLLPLGGQPLVYRVVKAALDSGLDKVVLVLGHAAGQIKEAISYLLNNPKLKIVENPHYEKGMSSSLKAGLKVVEKDFDHVMVILGDMPHIDAPLIDLLLDKYLSSECDLGAVRIGGRRSHPAIFSRKLYAGLYSAQGEAGGRRLFELHGRRACFVDPGPSYRYMDMDTPEDYEKLKKLFE